MVREVAKRTGRGIALLASATLLQLSIGRLSDQLTNRADRDLQVGA